MQGRQKRKGRQEGQMMLSFITWSPFYSGIAIGVLVGMFTGWFILGMTLIIKDYLNGRSKS
jgi:hypothetical protein